MTGQITVTTAGTRVQGTSTPCIAVLLKALPSNTGVIYVGNSTVDSSTGFPLEAGGTMLAEVADLNELYFDASENAQKVAYFKLKGR